MSKASQIINSIARSTERSISSWRERLGAWRPAKWLRKGGKFAVLRRKGCEPLVLQNPGPIKWSEDMRFGNVRHDEGTVTFSHEDLLGFDVTEVDARLAKAKVIHGGW